jgi:hypothetical protein
VGLPVGPPNDFGSGRSLGPCDQFQDRRALALGAQ